MTKQAHRDDSVKRLLITGGSGFVGGHVAVKAKSKWNVTGTFRSKPPEWTSIQTVPLRLEDRDSILEVMDNVRPHVVIHCGAWSNLDQCEQQRESAFRINVEGTSVLADACAGSGVRLIFTSSDMVFDGERGHYDESDKTRPINFYGETKLLAEEKIQSICTDYVIVRVALVYGKPVTQGNSFSEKILSRFQKNTSMSLFRDQFRTPVWVQTVAEALLELADHSYSGVLHVAGSEKVDRYKFGLTLAEIRQYSSNLCKPVCMSELQTTAPRPKDVSLNISLAKQILKTCFIGYREGLAHDYAFNTNKM